MLTFNQSQQTQWQIALLSGVVIAVIFSKLSASQISGTLGKFGGMAIGMFFLFLILPCCIQKALDS